VTTASDEIHNRRRGRPKASAAVPEDTILAVALKQFALLGYDGASLRTINRELGVSHNLLYQRFGTKEGLWRAAVDYGFGGLVAYMQGIFDPTIAEPLEQLRLAVRQFLIYSHDRPELLALMNSEGRQSTERLDYIVTRYIAPSQSQIARLLAHLADDGTIRRVPHATFFFLATAGGAAPFTLAALAKSLGSPAAADDVSIAEHAELVSTMLIEGLRLPPAEGRR
jgi:AcrR family transcriptional regulator